MLIFDITNEPLSMLSIGMKRRVRVQHIPYFSTLIIASEQTKVQQISATVATISCE